MNRESMSDELLLRYNRQIMLPAFDIKGQETLRNACVLIVGLGGLGCPAAMYLSGSGVGRLVLADYDVVELSNLQRQIAHGNDDLGKNKAQSVAETVAALNPDVDVQVKTRALQDETLDEAVREVEAVVDASDNFTTRFAVNAACVRHRVPLISGAAIRMEGQLSVFDSRKADSPCYHCLYSDVQEEQLSCSEAGVMSPLVGVIGSWQALETVKVLTGLGDPLVGRLALFDATYGQWREFKVKRDPGCAVCRA